MKTSSSSGGAALTPTNIHGISPCSKLFKDGVTMSFQGSFILIVVDVALLCGPVFSVLCYFS